MPAGDTSRFVDSYRRIDGDVADPRGEIVSSDGRALGKHRGVHRYTVGQRKGLGIATGSPLYVLSMDAATQRVVVGDNDELLSSTCEVRDVNWIAFAEPPELLRAQAKIRHQHFPAEATLYRDGNHVRVVFDAPQRAIAPGQAAVFYQDDLVIGGGWIHSAAR